MNDGNPDAYSRLNLNEKRIIDFFEEHGVRCLIARPVLEARLCKTKLMDQRTLTTRLEYLIDRGILGKAIGSKGAVLYAPRFVIDTILNDPLMKCSVDNVLDNLPPKKPYICAMPVKVKLERISNAEAKVWAMRAAETWERVGVASKREKEKFYRKMRGRWKGRSAVMGSKHAWKETPTEREMRLMRERADRIQD